MLVTDSQEAFNTHNLGRVSGFLEPLSNCSEAGYTRAALALLTDLHGTHSMHEASRIDPSLWLHGKRQGQEPSLVLVERATVCEDCLSILSRALMAELGWLIEEPHL